MAISPRYHYEPMLYTTPTWTDVYDQAVGRLFKQYRRRHDIGVWANPGPVFGPLAPDPDDYLEAWSLANVERPEDA